MLAAFVFALFALPAHPASAQGKVTNPACWPQEMAGECAKAGGKIEPALECGSGWGRCYPQKDIDIQIHIPGLEGQKVRDLGQYIQVIYVWAVRVAAVLAVVVIMVGGLLWLTSAGAERLGKAKELIGNAVIGLLIAVGSYVILQTINPDLVRLSLPRIAILRPVLMGAKFCDAIARQAEVAGSVMRFGTESGGPYSIPFANSDTFRCGKTLYPDPAGVAMNSCFGSYCPTRQVCVPKGGATYGCVDGIMGGQINYSDGAFIDEMKLMVLCRNGSRDSITSFDVEEGEGKRGVQKFAMQPLGRETLSGLGACGGAANQRGFYLDIEVNDTDWKWWSVGLAYDDWFSVGKSSCNGEAKPFMGTDDGKPSAHPRHINWAQVSDSELWSVGEIFPEAIQATRTSVVCSFNIDPQTFVPRVGGSAGGSG